MITPYYNCHNCSGTGFIYRRARWTIPVAIVVITILQPHFALFLFLFLFLNKKLQCVLCKEYIEIDPESSPETFQERLNRGMTPAEKWSVILNNPPPPNDVDIIVLPWHKRPVGIVAISSLAAFLIFAVIT